MGAAGGGAVDVGAAGGEVRALRRQIREWRRGRADTRLVDALSDAYIAVFATVMLGSMAVNVVRHARMAATSVCVTEACSNARSVLPWVFAGGVVTVTLVIARTFGPLLVSPAEAAWLLSAPVDRASLLRPRLAFAAALAVGAGVLLGALLFTLGGFAAAPVAGFTAALAAACLAAVAFAVLGQAHGPRMARVATWASGAAVWAGLLLLATDVLSARLSPAQQLRPVMTLPVVALWLLAAGLCVRAVAALPRLHRDRLTPGGSLLPSLSGALAGLDLALMYDIVLSSRWRARATVRPVRGGPGGAWALVWRDLVRLRRSAGPLVLLTASLVVPYVAATLGLGVAVPAVAALTAFVSGLGLCSGLRVLARTPGLIRCLPMSATAVRSAGLVVPGAVLLGWGFACAPAIHRAMPPVSWAESLAVGAAVGLGAVAAVARWVTAAPPDYSRPLVSSPAGAIPTTLIGSVARGLDVLLLVTAPLLLARPGPGALASVVLAGIVLAVLLGRTQGRSQNRA